MDYRFYLLKLALLTAVVVPLVAGCGAESTPPPTGVAPRPVVHAPAQPAPAVQSRSEKAAVQAPAAPPEKDGPAPKIDSSSTRPLADREETKPGDAVKISFDDLILGMGKDDRFRPFMLNDRVKELAGQRVRISGMMHGGVESVDKNKKWVLLRNKECKYGPGGQADHVALVEMKEGVTAKYVDSTIRIEGVLHIEPFEGTDGLTWHIYKITDAQLR